MSNVLIRYGSNYDGDYSCKLAFVSHPSNSEHDLPLLHPDKSNLRLGADKLDHSHL